MVTFISDRDFGIFENKYRDYDIKLYLFLETTNLLNNISDKYKTVMELLHNKKLFYNYMIDNFAEHIPKIINTYPYIIKPIVSTGSENVIVVYDETSYLQNIHKILTLDHIKQEYILSDKFYVANMLFKHGEYIYGNVYVANKRSAYEILREPIKYIAHTTRKLTDMEINVFGKILGNLNYHGMCCIDYDYVNETIVIFEINPRLGISLYASKNDLNLFIKKMIEFDINYETIL